MLFLTTMTADPLDGAEPAAPSKGLPPRKWLELAFPILLALSAGLVDALGFVLLGRTLVAHMSGNSAVSAVYLERGQLTAMAMRFVPIPCFVIGVLVGKILAVELARRQHPYRFSLLLAAEVLCLCAFPGLAATHPPRPWILMAPLACGMGLQSAALRHAAGHDVRTSFVTGMLVGFAEEAIDHIAKRDTANTRPGFHGLIWLSFFAGASIGGWLSDRLGASAAIVPIALVSMTAVLGWVRPPSQSPA